MVVGDPSQIRLCTFRLGDMLLGVDVRAVQEVLRDADLTPVPHAAAAICGLINLRGEIAIAMDLRTRLGMAPAEDREGQTHVVVASVGEPVSLLVDEIGDVIDVGPDRYEPPPVTMDPLTAELVLGTYKLDDELLLVLDVPRVVAAPAEQAGVAA